MSQQFALRPRYDGSWSPVDPVSEVERVLRSLRPRGDDHDRFERPVPEQAIGAADPGRVFLC